MAGRHMDVRSLMNTTPALPEGWQNLLAGELADMAATTRRLNKLAARRTCKHCHEPASAHCPWCGACPTNDCPDWCEPDTEE